MSSWVVSATVVPPRTPIFIGFAWIKVGIGVTSRAAHRCATPMLGWFLFVFHSDYSQTNTPWKRLKRKNECVTLDDVPFHYAVVLSFQLLVFILIVLNALWSNIFNEAQHLRNDVSSVFKQSVLGSMGIYPYPPKEIKHANASVRDKQWCLINVNNPVLKCTKALCLRNMDAPSHPHDILMFFVRYCSFYHERKRCHFLDVLKVWSVVRCVYPSLFFVDEICKNGL